MPAQLATRHNHGFYGGYIAARQADREAANAQRRSFSQGLITQEDTGTGRTVFLGQAHRPDTRKKVCGVVAPIWLRSCFLKRPRALPYQLAGLGARSALSQEGLLLNAASTIA